MKKLLCMLAMIPFIAQGISIRLPLAIKNFDIDDALNQLAQSLESKSISQKEARQLYTTIFTKALLKKAERIQGAGASIKKGRLHYSTEYITYEEATRQAIKELEAVLVSPEKSMSVLTKITQSIPYRALLS